MTLRAGDFTALAKDYARNRPGYAEVVREALLAHVGARAPGFRAADVGAGTGIWTRMLAEAGVSMTAVEPNDAMRLEGIDYTKGVDVHWQPGSAEKTGLETASVNWLTMASSFHWADTPVALAEFHRALKPGGHLTVLWNPRNIEGHPLHERIEQVIYDHVPELQRVSSGASKHARDWAQELPSTGHFTDVIFFEARHTISMSKERYMGAWRSVNDIQQQAGPERFARILATIEDIIAPLPEVEVPYKTRAWTGRRVNR